LLIVEAVAMAFRYEGFEVAKAMNGAEVPRSRAPGIRT
jgi:hypothetical protein